MNIEKKAQELLERKITEAKIKEVADCLLKIEVKEEEIRDCRKRIKKMLNNEIESWNYTALSIELKNEKKMP